MNLLLINSGDENAFAALYSSKDFLVSYSSEFKNETLRKLPDNLINCLQKLSANNREEFDKVEAVAITVGPGSFTGIRVGLAIAKGIASAFSIPIIPVSNFELTYNRISSAAKEHKYCILIPAKLPEYYYSIWSDGKEVNKGCIELDRFSTILDENSTIVANFDNETKVKHSYFDFIKSENLEGEAKTMLKLARNLFTAGNFKEPGDIVPLYMKDFVIKKHK